MKEENMQDLFDNMADLYDKFLESLEEEFEYDVPDSFQIAGIEEEDLEEELEMASDEEIQQLLGDLWDEVLPLQPSSGVGNVTVLDRDEEYTERDAFNDFIADQQEDWN